MFKDMIAPVQAWLISQGRCVGCGTPLAAGSVKKRQDGFNQVRCKCGRVFLKDPKKITYRRALLSEID